MPLIAGDDVRRLGPAAVTCYLAPMYGELKQLLLDASGIRPAHLHLLFGVIFYALCFAVTRRPWLSFWLLVAVQIGNEALDIREDVVRGRRPDIEDSAWDTLWTVAMPAATAGVLAAATVLWSAIRYLTKSPR